MPKKIFAHLSSLVTKLCLSPTSSQYCTFSRTLDDIFTIVTDFWLYNIFAHVSLALYNICTFSIVNTISSDSQQYFLNWLWFLTIFAYLPPIFAELSEAPDSEWELVWTGVAGQLRLFQMIFCYMTNTLVGLNKRRLLMMTNHCKYDIMSYAFRKVNKQPNFFTVCRLI
jgi:hypothetical protein